MSSISVIIPVRNDARRLGACLRSINGHHRAVVEVVVADNGSTDDSPRVARASGARVLIIPEVTVGELRNRAAREAAGDLLAFVDADHVLAPAALDAAAETLAEPCVGAAGALYLPPPEGTWVQRTYGALRGQTVGRQETTWLGSGNLIVRREAFLSVNGFDTTLEACEDVDLCQRLVRAGWRIVADERIVSFHHGDPTTLASLFRAERWRARDNFRVSFRGPLSLRSLPSLLIPPLLLAGGGAILLGLLVAPFLGVVGLSFILSGGAIVAGIVGLRALRILKNTSKRSITAARKALGVAAAYDFGRAAALLTRAPHHRR